MCNIVMKKIDGALERWMSEGEARTKDLIEEHWDNIEKLAGTLLENEIMYEEALKDI